MNHVRQTLLLFTFMMNASLMPTYAQLQNYFSNPIENTSTPDSQGFIHRWYLMEPIEKKNRTNTVFTDSYLRDVFYQTYFKNQFSLVPKDGLKTKVDKDVLRWHKLDSNKYNVKLFRFGEATKNRLYGVLYWVVTIIECDDDVDNVRLAVGSNSASMWWLNGDEILLLSGDRRMVVDDAMSKRVTLKKGENILRGAIINGPGMSDFCVRFVDEKGKPIRNITIK